MILIARCSSNDLRFLFIHSEICFLEQIQISWMITKYNIYVCIMCIFYTMYLLDVIMKYRVFNPFYRLDLYFIQFFLGLTLYHCILLPNSIRICSNS